MEDTSRRTHDLKSREFRQRVMSEESRQPEDIAEERIAEAARTKDTGLDLSSLGLKTLTESMEKLRKLTRIFLHGNSVLGIPVEVLGPSIEEVARDRKPANPAEKINPSQLGYILISQRSPKRSRLGSLLQPTNIEPSHWKRKT
jgi:hypothetical protein